MLERGAGAGERVRRAGLLRGRQTQAQTGLGAGCGRALAGGRAGVRRGGFTRFVGWRWRRGGGGVAAAAPEAEPGPSVMEAEVEATADPALEVATEAAEAIPAEASRARAARPANRFFMLNSPYLKSAIDQGALSPTQMTRPQH